MANNIHATAIIDSSAKLAAGVSVGPYSIIGPGVEIDANTHIGSHVVIGNTSKTDSSQIKIGSNVEIGPHTVIGSFVTIGEGTWIGPNVHIGGPSVIGKNNKIFQFASIGEGPQDLSYKGEDTRLEMGDNNLIRECVTIHRGTVKGIAVTKMGNGNLLMAYAHVAHDCILHNNTIMLNNSALAGHVELEDHSMLGAYCAVHQFSRIGAYAFVTRSCLIPRDIPPFLLVAGPVARAAGLNLVGLRRHGFSREALKNLLEAYKIIYRQKLSMENILEKLQELAKESPEVQRMVTFIEQAQKGRGILKVSRKADPDDAS